MNASQFWQERMDYYKQLVKDSRNDPQMRDAYARYEMMARTEIELAEAVEKVNAKR